MNAVCVYQCSWYKQSYNIILGYCEYFVGDISNRILVAFLLKPPNDFVDYACVRVANHSRPLYHVMMRARYALLAHAHRYVIAILKF